MPDAPPTFRPAHLGERTKRGDKRRNLYGRPHRRWRDLVLAADPVCHWPIEGGRVCRAEATEADHIIPIVKDEAKRFDLHNGQGLCRAHHQVKGEEERRGIYRSTRGGDPTVSVPSLTKRWVVCGPPCSGKSTYIEEHAEPADEIISLDRVFAEVTGRPLYDKPDRYLDEARAVFDRRLDGVIKRGARAWVEIGGASKKQRSYYLRKLAPAEIVLLKTPAHECKRRAVNAGRPVEWLRYVDRWWDRYESERVRR